jgi:predicted Zn-dependent protease
MVDDVLETETLAWVYLKQGHPKRAAEIFERLLSADRDNQSAIRGLSSCRELLGDRGREAGMANNEKLLVLQQMLARLTGTQFAGDGMKAGARATVKAEQENPREKKLRLLKSMLDRLSGGAIR